MKIRKKRVSMFAKLNTENGSSDDCHAIEKAKSKRPEVECCEARFDVKNLVQTRKI